MIVIPAIDVRAGRAVRLTKGIAGSETVYTEDPAEVAARFVAEGATWLHLVDLDAALGSGGNPEVVRAVIATAGVPVEVGGGLRSVADVEHALALGASRVVLGTAAVTDRVILEELAARFSDRIVVAIDTDGTDVLIRGWTDTAGPLSDILPALEAAGAPRFLATAVDRDGTLEGPDVALYERLTALTSRPVLASGGVADADDVRALAKTSVEGVVVGKALYEGKLTVADAMGAAS